MNNILFKIHQLIDPIIRFVIILMLLDIIMLAYYITYKHDMDYDFLTMISFVAILMAALLLVAIIGILFFTILRIIKENKFKHLVKMAIIKHQADLTDIRSIALTVQMDEFPKADIIKQLKYLYVCSLENEKLSENQQLIKQHILQCEQESQFNGIPDSIKTYLMQLDKNDQLLSRSLINVIKEVLIKNDKQAFRQRIYTILGALFGLIGLILVISGLFK